MLHIIAYIVAGAIQMAWNLSIGTEVTALIALALFYILFDISACL